MEAFIYLFPFVVVILFFFPYFYLIHEMYDDYKDRRLRQLKLFGMKKSVDMMSWFIFTFVIVMYYSLVISFIGNNIT